MTGAVEQKREGAAQNRPNKSILISLAVGIYSVLAAIISLHFFGFELFYRIILLSPAGFAAFFAFFFLSGDLRKSGLKKVFMDSFQVMGDVMGRGILILLYYTVFLIPGIPVAAFGDRLQIKKKPTTWSDRMDHEYTLERAREQW